MSEYNGLMELLQEFCNGNPPSDDPTWIDELWGFELVDDSINIWQQSEEFDGLYEVEIWVDADNFISDMQGVGLDGVESAIKNFRIAVSKAIRDRLIKGGQLEMPL